jgi:hypothetical protein
MDLKELMTEFVNGDGQGSLEFLEDPHCVQESKLFDLPNFTFVLEGFA